MDEEHAIVVTEWPQPDAGAPLPLIVADDSSLLIRYYSHTGKVVVVHFPLCTDVRFGSPSDETLSGHPLYGRGLRFYSVHSVENSSWIAKLERMNSVHPGHDRKWFLENKRHFIFTFHDSTLECVVNENKATDISEFTDEAEANAFIQTKLLGG